MSQEVVDEKEKAGIFDSSITQFQTVEMVKFLLDSSLKITTNTIRLAIEVGNLDILKFFCESKQIPIDQKLVVRAARNGHLHIIHYFESLFKPIFQQPTAVEECLMASLKGGHLKLVKYFVSIHQTFDQNTNSSNQSQSQYYYSKLAFFACLNGKIQVLKWLVEELKAPLDFCDELQRTPIFAASWLGDLEIVKYLVSKQVDLNVVNHDAQTPLMVAFYQRKLDVVKCLIESGKADLNVGDKLGQTLLFWACLQNSLDVVKLLVEHGCDLNLANMKGITGLWISCNAEHSEIVKYLISIPKCDTNKVNNEGNSPLWILSSKNNLELVKYLVENNSTGTSVDLNCSNNLGQTPLFISCFRGNLEIVKYLISKGAHKNKSDNQNQSPLFIACKENHLEIVQFLISNGADVNKPNNQGATLLFCAVNWNQIEIAKFLLEKTHIDKNKPNKDNQSPLSIAIQRGLTSMVQLLVSNGVEFRKSDKFGITPLELAKSFNRPDIVAFLSEKLSGKK